MIPTFLLVMLAVADDVRRVPNGVQCERAATSRYVAHGTVIMTIPFETPAQTRFTNERAVHRVVIELSSPRDDVRYLAFELIGSCVPEAGERMATFVNWAWVVCEDALFAETFECESWGSGEDGLEALLQSKGVSDHDQW